MFQWFVLLQGFVVQAQRHWFCIFQGNLDHGRVRRNEQLGQDGNAETGFDQYACGFEGFAEVKIGHGVSGCEHGLKAADLSRGFFRVDQDQALVLEVGDAYRGTLCQGAVRGADTDDRDFGKFPVGPVRAAGVGKAEDDIHILIFQKTVQVLERDGEKAGMQVGMCFPHFSQDVRKKKQRHVVVAPDGENLYLVIGRLFPSGRSDHT